MTQTTSSASPTTRTVSLRPDLSITLTEVGSGRPVLVLHGGGGPFTVAAIVEHLATSMHVIAPVHPGWNGTERPASFDGVDDLASAYLQYLDENDLRDVLVIGSSLGGWIASEMALRDTTGIVTGLILVNAVGVTVDGSPVRDFFALDARGVAEYSFHDPQKFYRDPAALPPAQVAAQAANMATMKVYVGEGEMGDPTLSAQLAVVQIPVLVAWGESDRIATPAYGRAFAEAFGNARFEPIREAGHLPHFEQPEATFALIDDFIVGA